MIQIITQSVPRELIEERVLEILSIEVRDLETLTHDSVPLGYARYHVYRHGRFLGRVEDWETTYYTNMVSGYSKKYGSLYDAVTCWVEPHRLKHLEEIARQQLTRQRESMPDYF